MSIWLVWLSGLTGVTATEQDDNALPGAAAMPSSLPETGDAAAENTSDLAAVNSGKLLQAENVDLDKPIKEQDIVASALDAMPARELQSNGQGQEGQIGEPGRVNFGNSVLPDPAKSSSKQVVSTERPGLQAGSGGGDDASATAESAEKSSGLQAADTAVATTQPQSEPADADVQSQSVMPKPFVLLGTEVPPATSTRLAWAPSQSFEGIYSATPVLVVNGAKPGPTLCLTAALHGDELNGIETVRRVLYNLDATKLRGTVVGVPIVNLQGFRRGSRYLTDRRDLNRYFPGDAHGSSAARIAHSFFHEIIMHCSAVVDLHTGSFNRTNLPQLRGDLTNPKVVKMTEGFGSTVVLHSKGEEGTLRRAAVAVGVPTVTLEAGAPMALNEAAVSHSVKGIQTLLNHLDMVSKFSLWGDPQPVYYNSAWQRVPEGGIIFSQVRLGSTVRVGDLLGTVTNPITNVRTEIRSTYNGRILGMALNQVVQPGFAAYHIGIQAPEEQISKPEEVTAEVEQEPSQQLLGSAQDNRLEDEFSSEAGEPYMLNE